MPKLKANGFIVDGKSFTFEPISNTELRCYVNGVDVGNFQRVFNKWRSPFSDHLYDSKREAVESYLVNHSSVVIEVDWSKVRRRIEDRLRKDIEAVKEVAKILNISTK